MVLHASKNGIFPLQSTEARGHPGMLACVAKVSDRSCLTILAPKQVLERFPTALAPITAGNTSEKLLNEIRQTICYLY